jgi:hypothetical protein
MSDAHGGWGAPRLSVDRGARSRRRARGGGSPDWTVDLDLALARSAWKSMVVVRLGAGNTALRWSKTPLPALENLGELRHAFGAADRDRILLDDSAPTALKRAWGPQTGAAPFGGSLVTTRPLASPLPR